jgi:hypothetical protein
MSRLGSAIGNRYTHTWLGRLVEEARNRLGERETEGRGTRRGHLTELGRGKRCR